MLMYNNTHYMCEKEISSRYELSIHWFRASRYNKTGPKYYKLKGRIYYTTSDVDEWMKEHLREVKAKETSR